MAFVLIMDFPGGTREQYEDVVERMGLDGKMDPGGLAHVAGSYDGGWRVIDVWEDAAHFERFRDAKIMPHTQAVGLAEPTVRAFEVDALHEGNGGTPGFAQIVFLDGMDAEGFEQMDRQILPDGNRPDAVVWHVHGSTDGGWCVVDTWRSKEERDRFIQERVMPAMQAAGVSGPPAIEDMPVEASMGVGAVAA